MRRHLSRLSRLSRLDIRIARLGIRPALAAVTATVLGVSVTACGGSGNDGSRTRLTVLAASSLTDAFQNAGAAYEKHHPDVRIRFSFAGSQTLAAQVRHGQPADVLATANLATMRGVKGETEQPSVFAKNRLTIVTTPGNPHNVDALRDLAADDLKVVLAAPEVPAGRYSQRVLKRQGVKVDPVSLETSVRSVLSKVMLGEADAGIVYETDANAAGDRVAEVGIPAARNAPATYPVAVLDGSDHPREARTFTEWLSSPQGFEYLRAEGFRAP